MRLSDLVTFREDLLFNGAVQLSWLETDRERARKAAEHFIFHGPQYHGAGQDVGGPGDQYRLQDTASFTVDLLDKVYTSTSDDPFSLAIAGYGSGKSHLAVTLATLLQDPASESARKIVDNLKLADPVLGVKAQKILSKAENKPFLVVALNGMADFDLAVEVTRQIISCVDRNGLDLTVAGTVRPRFRAAENFVKSFFELLRPDFDRVFGPTCSVDSLCSLLRKLDEGTFQKLNEIYLQKMGSSIPVSGQESLQDIIKAISEAYCGPGKPFAGIIILFDEFGRYLEFAVQKPYVAGSGALQQLFEAVQNNADTVSLVCFIQYELRAYVSRVAPELRDDLVRYITRYDTINKVRLSSNLETLIASMLEKKLDQGIPEAMEPGIHSLISSWFPEIINHAVWSNRESFVRIVQRGCWPLHPLTTWVLYRLSSVGRTLQQRSALSMVADVMRKISGIEYVPGATIRPIDLCSVGLVDEFLASEGFGQQGASAHAFESVLQRYGGEFSVDALRTLQAVLISGKIGAKFNSTEQCISGLSMFSGVAIESTARIIDVLSREYGVLEWNEILHQYDIVGDAVPRRAFLNYLEDKVKQIDTDTRADIFSQNFGEWIGRVEFNTDFGTASSITTREWNYTIHYSNVSRLSAQIDYALRVWHDAMSVEDRKGQLIYCYVGMGSNLDEVTRLTKEHIKRWFSKSDCDAALGAPMAVFLIYDTDGSFGRRLAEYWTILELSDDEKKRFGNHVDTRKEILERELSDQFDELERHRRTVFATDAQVKGNRTHQQLTSLFEAVYPRRLPFPFDGFHTTRGNAAKDCRLFTSELFCGRLDRDKISTLSPQQKNRAYEVLDKSWGALALDGSVKMRPANRAVAAAIDLIELEINGTDGDSPSRARLGDIVRKLCRPPYGCSIASAGLVLALFMGRRKGEIALLKGDQPTSYENWISEALSGSFLDMRVLDITYAIHASETSVSEWDKLLDEWESEESLVGKIRFREKANELNARFAVPQVHFWRFTHLSAQADASANALADWSSQLQEALSRVDVGKSKGDVSNLSWGAADLSRLLRKMNAEPRKWETRQILKVERLLSDAVSEIHSRFPEWLPQQVVYSAVHLDAFRRRVKNVASNLEELGMLDEHGQLLEHLTKLEKNILQMEEIRQAASDVDTLISQNTITSITPLDVLERLLEHSSGLDARLSQAAEMGVAKGLVKSAREKLDGLRKKCREQIQRYQETMSAIYNIQRLDSLGDIEFWRQTVSAMMVVYSGHDQDIEDLKSVQRQIDLLEKHRVLLTNETLSPSEFEQACSECLAQVKAEFGDEAPPLDEDAIYESMIALVKNERERAASDWLRRNLPGVDGIERMDARSVLDIRSRLQSRPRFLSDQQVAEVDAVLEACDKRLDDLEVEGLIARFLALPSRAKRAFIRAILKHTETEDQ